MAATLRHHAGDQLETHDDESASILVGRIGLQHLNAREWPRAVEAHPSRVRCFVSGPLDDGAQDSERHRLPVHAELRAWRGFFSAVLHHAESASTLLIADCRASVPIFYAQVGSWLVFAPEVKALLVVPSIGREIDLAALAGLMAQGHVLGGQTTFKAVRRLRAGELLRIGHGRTAREVYWTFEPGRAVDRVSSKALAREFGDVVEAAIARHVGDPAKTIIFLSGGADSRGILGGALTAVSGEGHRLRTITWGANADLPHSDVVVARELAAHVGTQHRFRDKQVADYKESFTELNRLSDGLSELAALHPGEYRIMVDLRADGFQRALRGDEVFGWSTFAATYEEALGLVRLRRLRDAPGLAGVIRRERYASLCEASDAAVEEALHEVRDVPPNQAKDRLYFHHRLQCFLHTASYWKLIELDYRNPLLDESILDFLRRVPERLRLDKELYRQALALKYPALAQFPFAPLANNVKWETLLTTDSPIRDYVLAEFRDSSSGIWEYLDPDALAAMLRAPEPASRHLATTTTGTNARRFVRTTLERLSPGALSWIQNRRPRPVFPLSTMSIVMRALVLKTWHDTFVTGRDSTR